MAATAPILSRPELVVPRPAPHVAFLMGNLHGGGVQRMTMLLADGLAAQGARVDLVVCDTREIGRAHV